MKPHLLRFDFTSLPGVPDRPDCKSRVLIAFSLSFVVFIAACNKNKTAQADKDDAQMGQRSESSVGERLSQEAVKDLFWSRQRQREAFREQRLDSIGKLSTSALVTTIRNLDLAGDATDRSILPQIFLALAEKDPGRFLEMLDEMPGEYYKTAIFQAFPYLANENPEILQDYVLTRDFRGKRDRWLMIGACEFLGKENPRNAPSFFDKLPDERKQGPLGSMLLKQAASEEPDLVVDFLVRDRTAPYFTSLFRDVLYTILESDPSLALKLASSYPEVRNTDLIAGVYTSMARKNPGLALEEISNASAEVRMETLTRHGFDNDSYFSKLFAEDSAKTIGLLKGIIPSATNSELFEEAANKLSGLPAGPVRDSSVRTFAEVIRPADPETADRWLESLR